MWSSGGEENYITTSTNFNRVPSSSSSSSSQSYSPFSITSPLPNQRKIAMEGVWKDISLSSLRQNPTRGGRNSLPKPNNTQNQGTYLQDFLARPFGKDPSPNMNRDGRLLGSPSPSPSPPPPPPPSSSLGSSLNLNSEPEFHYLDNIPNPACENPFLNAFASSAISPFCKKRVSESEDNRGGDHRHKRMIKNRESASRSRARKQAYTNQLEQEIIQLTEENTRLKEKEKQLDSLVAAAAAQLPKKRSLLRTITAPF